MELTDTLRRSQSQQEGSLHGEVSEGRGGEGLIGGSQKALEDHINVPLGSGDQGTTYLLVKVSKQGSQGRVG